MAWAREAGHGQGRRWRAGQAGLSRGREQGAAEGSGRGGARKGEGRERRKEREKEKKKRKMEKEKEKEGREGKGEIRGNPIGGDNDVGRARAAVAAACRGCRGRVPRPGVMRGSGQTGCWIRVSGSGLSGIGRSVGKRFELNDEKLFKPFYRVN